MLERIAESRAGDTWRNIAALQRVKVIEYEHGGARVQQTTEIGDDVIRLRGKGIHCPPSGLHGLE